VFPFVPFVPICACLCPNEEVFGVFHNIKITYKTPSHTIKNLICSYKKAISNKMKKPSVIFILKCTAILYISAFTNIDNLTKGKAATPLITKGNCKVQVLGQDEFTAFTFAFNANGTVTASKDNLQIKGLWMEDNIDKKINIRFNTYNPTIQKLNNRWLIKEVTKNQLLIQSSESSNASFVTIASL
jgi:hypothetical protein